jgi:hypothetical protein
MPKFELAKDKAVNETDKPREFVSIPVLPTGENGQLDTTKLKEVLASMTGGALILVLDLTDETENPMKTPARDRATKGGGTSTSVIYGESKKLFSGLTDEGQPITVKVEARRKLSGTDDDEEEENATE